MGRRGSGARPRAFDDAAPGFASRAAAGRVLAEQLLAHRGRPNVVILGLVRGGIPVAAEVARALAAPLDVLIVRKLGVPGHEELAAGAIAESGALLLNDDVVSAEGVTRAQLDGAIARESAEIERRQRLYRRDRSALALTDRSVILVDDGLATGATMRASILAVRNRGAAEVVAAAPVGARETCAALGELADAVVCVLMPDPFIAVGAWYADFRPTADDEVIRLLERFGRSPASSSGRVPYATASAAPGTGTPTQAWRSTSRCSATSSRSRSAAIGRACKRPGAS